MSRPSSIRALAIVSLCFGLAAGGATAGIRVVAHTDGRAPGAGSLARFHRFGVPQIDADGRTSFHAWIQGAVLSGGDSGIWSERGGSLAQQARIGLEPPGLEDDAEYETLGVLRVDAGGAVFFQAAIASSEYESALFEADASGIDPRVVSNIGAPDIGPGVYLGGFLDFDVFAGGLVFVANLIGSGVTSGNRYALYVDAGTPSLLARAGEIAPGGADVWSGQQTALVNAAGEVAFRSALAGGSVAGIWAEGDAGLELVMRSDALPPGFAGLQFGAFSMVGWNANREVAFTSNLGPGAVEDGQGLWLGAAGSLGLVARQGDPAPGTSAEFDFIDPGNCFLDELGEATFIGWLRSGNPSNDRGIWSGVPGDVALLVREADDAPGVPGAELGDFENLAVAGNGRVTFESALRGPSVSDSNDRSLWRLAGGEPRLLLREGQLLEIEPGDARTVESWEIAVLDVPPRRNGPLNDAGEVALLVEFDDATQAIVVVPEPSATAAALAAVGSLWTRRRLARGLLSSSP
jgi:hypothetical protein